MIGKVISHYKILEKLGEGGMGVVYKAEDTKLERTVALKFLPSAAAGSDDERARFIEEARAAAALDHPNICTVYEIDESDGQSFIAMAFVEGRSLKDTLDERPLKINDALKSAIQIAKGLSAAHENGIVHRDIKSANIMVTPRGRTKIMDFGLARRGEAYQKVAEESTLGTISYSSPEQVGGTAMDHRTDIWSFGVTLFEMITGQLPFRGDYEQAIVYSILNEVPEPVTGMRTGVPVDLERIIDKALAKNPKDRYQHIDDMLIDLKELQNEFDPTVSKTGSRTGTRPIYRQEVSWFRKMLDRHVVQILIVYLAATWGATRLMSFAVDRFVLSPHLTSIVAIAFLSLIPAVLLLAFFRGDRDQARWTKPEKIGVPLNILAALALLLVMFQGKEIGAATTTVAVENEEGQTIERVVPKNEFRKKLALYIFENVSGDTASNWLQYSIPDLLEGDLSQDPFLQTVSAFDESSYRRLQNAGFTDWQDAPVALKRKIARDSHMDYFVFGSVKIEGDTYTINSKLHDTQSGKVVAERKHTGADLFSLIDELSAQVKHDMGVPAGHAEDIDDVAVSEMLTNSVEAVKHLGLSRKLADFENNWQGGLEHLEAAVVEDPTLAWAYFRMFGLYRGIGQTEKSDAAIESAMQHLYKLPERVQFIVKANYYFVRQDPGKTFALFKMMTELYPTDILGHLGLSEMYSIRNEFEKAIAEYETILKLDPYRYNLLHTVANLNARLGKNDEALSYYQRYAELNPEESNSFTRLGGHFERIGDYEAAKENYEKALLIDPGEVPVLIELADIERKLGRSEAALRQYEDALQKARTAEDRARVYVSMNTHYQIHGQIDKAITYMNLMHEERAPLVAPLNAQLNRIDDVDLYVQAGRPDEAFEILKDVESQLGPPYDKVTSFGYVAVYAKLGDADRAQEAVEVAEAFVQSFGLEVMRPEILDCHGQIAEVREEYDIAIDHFEKQLELNPSAVTVNRNIGRCRRHMKDYERAEEHLLKVLAVYPFDPEANYELALVYDALGKKAEAAERLQKSLDVWKDADEGYEPAAKARELSESWKS